MSIKLVHMGLCPPTDDTNLTGNDNPFVTGNTDDPAINQDLPGQTTPTITTPTTPSPSTPSAACQWGYSRC